MRTRRVLAVLLAATTMAVTVLGCGGGNGDELSPSASPSVEISTTTPSPTPAPTSAEVSSPAADDVVTGVPNFEYYEACGHPCWLPVNPAPQLEDGLSITKKWPYEQYGSQDGDSITVVCSVQGEPIQDDRAVPTTSWYKVIVPKENVSIIDEHFVGLDIEELEEAPGGYYGFVPAIWVVLEEGAVLEPCS